MCLITFIRVKFNVTWSVDHGMTKFLTFIIFIHYEETYVGILMLYDKSNLGKNNNNVRKLLEAKGCKRILKG